ncbi:MAG: TetR family transcriptional regulator [Desulfobacterales bacterium]|nr:TetR family transcriptional regulator [Desulfobacterales bacterium]
MARKTKEEAEKTRLSILNAALDTFDEKGFNQTTLTDIATRAGVTRGAIYWHFKDKVDIVAKLRDQMEVELGERGPVGRVDSFENLNSVEELVQAFLSYFAILESDERYEKFYRFSIYKVEYTEEMQSILDREKKMTTGALYSLTRGIEQLIEKGVVGKELDPARCARSIIAFTWGIIELWIFDRTIMSLQDEGAEFLSAHIRRICV